MNSMHGGTLVTPDGPIAGHVHINNGQIIAVAPTDEKPEEGSSIVSPGLVDIQINGGWGHDFTADPSTIWEVGAQLPSTGVTAFVPTIVTAPYDVARAAISVLDAGPPEGYTGAAVLGLHIEGPWISPHWKGAHVAGHLQLPDETVAREWAESGQVRVVTMAPELDGASAVAAVLSKAGVTVSAGHSGADYATALAALDRDWTMATHLYNQMSGFSHRAPGVVGAALNSNRPCGLIADGLHSDPGALQLAWDRLGTSKTVLITDAMAAVGLAYGEYILGDLEVVVGSDGPRTPEGRLAGSTLTMDAAVRNMTRLTSASYFEALVSATTTPADAVGASDHGRLEAGSRGDIAIFDSDGNVEYTLIGGQVAFEAGN